MTKKLLNSAYSITGALAAILSGLTSLQADPVFFEGTGHYYEVISVRPQQITWNEAQAAAIARGGYLVTILSEAENAFVFDLVNDPTYWRDDLPFGPWIGGYQPPGSQEPDGGWTWVNGDGFFGAGSGGYSNWSPESPNDCCGSIEHWAHFYDGSGGRSARWNDLSQQYQQPVAYVVEYDSTPPLSLRRLSDLSDVDTPSQNAGIDVPLIPARERNVLANLQTVTKGLVADGVTPLVIRIVMPGAASAMLTFQNWQGGSIIGGVQLKVLHDGQWTSGQQVDLNSNGVGYAMISALQPLALQSLAPIITAEFVVSTGEKEDRRAISFRKPPVILVHGIGSNNQAWTSAFKAPFLNAGREVIAVNYGSVDVFPENLRACYGTLQDLAKDLDRELRTAVVIALPNDHWAATRADVVGHSQGGVLLRMLCVSDDSAKYFTGQMPFRTASNFNRGRFGRIVTVGSPHNGNILSVYGRELWERCSSIGVLGRSGILAELDRRHLLKEAKFNPFGLQIRIINNPHYKVDDLAPFHLLASHIADGRPPGETSTPAYNELALARPGVGVAILPFGSDGVVEPASALGDYFPGNSIGEYWSRGNVPHAGPNWLFGPGDNQTSSGPLAQRISDLLDLRPVNAFGRFPNIQLRDPNDEQGIKDLAPLPGTGDNIQPSQRPSKVTRQRTTSSTIYSFTLNTPTGNIQDDTLGWSCTVFGPGGDDETTGLFLSIDPSDPRLVSVSVDDTVVGEVVLTASYLTAAGIFMSEKPVIVVSRNPASAAIGIELRPSSVEFGVGAQALLEVWRRYEDGSTYKAFISSDAAVTLTSSNNTCVRVGQGLEVTAESAGSTILSVSFEGFATQTTATVKGFPPLAVNDGATAHDQPIEIGVLANDESFIGGPLNITAVTQPRFGTATISGAQIIYSPIPTGVNVDQFAYTVADSSAALNSATVTVQRPRPTPPPAVCHLTEAFDVITTLLPGGWVMQNNSSALGTTGWSQGNQDNPGGGQPFPSQSGAPDSYIAANYLNGSGVTTLSNWLLTPPVTLQNGARFTFWTRTVDPSVYPDRVQVRMSTDGASSDVGIAGTSIGDFTTLLLDINPTYTPSGYPNVWTQFSVTISGLSEPVEGRLAFRYFVENGGSQASRSDYIGIDTVQYDCTLAPGLQLTAAVSQKMHGNLGPFGVNLPLIGESGVECRNSGGNHTIVFTFNNSVVSGNANMTTGTGSLAGTPAFAGNTMTVNLTGVSDVQKVTVTLDSVTDSLAQVLPNEEVSVNFLIGDTNSNKTVNTSDIGQTKGQSGKPVTNANFSTDINLSGTLTASDISQVKANSGHRIP